MKYICVYGAVNDKIAEEYKQAGIELGKKISEKKYGLIYSGMKGGTSGSVAKGVAANGNMPIVGIMPEYFKEIKPNEIFEGCTKILYSKDLLTRKELMKNKCDAIIVLPGGVGTLDEFFDAICTKGLGLLNKPIIIYNINNYYSNLIKMLNYSMENYFIRSDYKTIFKIFDNLEDIFNYIDNY